jgi:hypothetical protein
MAVDEAYNGIDHFLRGPISNMRKYTLGGHDGRPFSA